MNENCENCIYWKRWYDETFSGNCRRYPPKLFYYSDSVGFTSESVATNANDWCGEWKFKEYSNLNKRFEHGGL